MRGNQPSLLIFAAALVMSLSVVSCGSNPDNAKASETFADCLHRNGIEAQGVEVTVGSDGTVESISLTIISEGEVAYEPALRLSCTEEVELNQ